MYDTTCTRLIPRLSWTCCGRACDVINCDPLHSLSQCSHEWLSDLYIYCTYLSIKETSCASFDQGSITLAGLRTREDSKGMSGAGKLGKTVANLLELRFGSAEQCVQYR